VTRGARLVVWLLALAAGGRGALPERAPPASVEPSAAAPDPEPPAAGPPRLSDTDVRRRTGLVFGAGLLGVAAYGANAGWFDDVTGSFGTRSEDWFGKHTYAGGADKLGHAYAGYAGTRLLADALEWAGNPPARAQGLAALATFGVLLGVEVLDGLERQHQFSWEDLLADAVGVGLGVWLERSPSIDALLDYRLQYWPADVRRRAPDTGADGDYDGQTYLLVAKASGVPALRAHPVLRYLELALGYGTFGYGTVDEEPVRGTRLLYYGPSINLSEVLASTVFRHSQRPGRAQRLADTVLEFVQVPGTAWLADSRL
jgi:hypothetical protein